MTGALFGMYSSWSNQSMSDTISGKIFICYHRRSTGNTGFPTLRIHQWQNWVESMSALQQFCYKLQRTNVSRDWREVISRNRACRDSLGTILNLYVPKCMYFSHIWATQELSTSTHSSHSIFSHIIFIDIHTSTIYLIADAGMPMFSSRSHGVFPLMYYTYLLNTKLLIFREIQMMSLMKVSNKFITINNNCNSISH